MTQGILTEFAGEWSCDNAMTVMPIRAGEPVESAQLTELCSDARTLFSLATLVCRALDRVRDCHRLWSEVLATFEGAQATWTDVPTDNDPVLRFYVEQLSRLVTLSRDRLYIYSVSQSDRETFVRRYRTDAPEERTPKLDSNMNAEEEKIEQFLSLPI